MNSLRHVPAHALTAAIRRSPVGRRLMASAATPPAPSASSSAAGASKPTERTIAPQRRSASNRPAAGSDAALPEGATNEPLPFFGSSAAAWTARQSQSGRGDKERLWYQPLVISGSLAAFLLYFCVLREESDIDGKLDGNLFDHVVGLEQIQVELALKYNRENGLPTEALKVRLAEMEAAAAAAKDGEELAV